MVPPIAIVAHPSRSDMVTELAALLPGVAICWDNDGEGAEATHMKAWRWLAEHTDEPWGVVLEDDVILCDDFLYQLDQALDHAPKPIVSLYLGRGRPPNRQEAISAVITREVTWIVSPELLSAQGYAMRIELFASGISPWCWRTGLPIDEAITASVTTKQTLIYKESRRLGYGTPAVAYTNPSLVDHRDGPTIIEHWDGPRNGKTALMAEDCDPSGADLDEVRKAWRFGPHTNWDRSTIRLEPHFTERDKHGHETSSAHGR